MRREMGRVRPEAGLCVDRNMPSSIHYTSTSSPWRPSTVEAEEADELRAASIVVNPRVRCSFPLLVAKTDPHGIMEGMHVVITVPQDSILVLMMWAQQLIVPVDIPGARHTTCRWYGGLRFELKASFNKVFGTRRLYCIITKKLALGRVGPTSTALLNADGIVSLLVEPR